MAPGTAVLPERMLPVTSLRVKSVITAPSGGAHVVVGKPLTIRGVAWSGDAGPVTAVDVSIDGGRSWKPATLQRDQRTRFGWRQWEYRWTPSREAYHTILARARDAGTNTQPFDQEWNPSGYGWNVIPRVGVNVVTGLSDATPLVQPAATRTSQPVAFKNACLACHDEDVVQQQRLTRAQWESELNKMIGWGARVGEEDRQSVLDYLVRSYGPRSR